MGTHETIIGLMSGTSADGVDAALVEIESHVDGPRVSCLAHLTLPYPHALRDQILAACSPEVGTVDLICELNFRLGEEFGRAAIAVAERAGVPLSAVDLIGSHGQTIYHIPHPPHSVPNPPATGATLQIGEPSVIAERTGITTVADFRPRDMAAGGTGAPLAPQAHYLLFRNQPGTRIIQNIGGIANTTLISEGMRLEEVVAFDTGPGNMVLDAVVAELTEGEQRYDADGRWAARGTPNEKWLAELLNHPFILQPPPKATGREEFGTSYACELIEKARALGLSPEDLLATVTALTAEAILFNYRHFVFSRGSVDEVVMCGGGAGNATLISHLQRGLEAIRLITSDAYGIPADAMEAVVFAVLAHQTLRGCAGNLPQVTGAARGVVLGKIVPGAGFQARLAPGDLRPRQDGGFPGLPGKTTRTARQVEA